MNGKDLHDAMSYLDDDIIYEAEITKFHRSPWKMFLASAAVLVLLVGAGAAIIGPPDKGPAELAAPPVSGEPIADPPTQETAPMPSDQADPECPASEEPSFENPDTEAERLNWDPSLPLMEDEFVLSNGISMGMTYEQAMTILESTAKSSIESSTSEFFWDIRAEDVLYTFEANSEGTMVLTRLHIDEHCTDLSFGRNYHIGEAIEEVFASVPARDTELKKWAIQTIYEDGNYSSYLRFVAMSFYAMDMRTQNLCLEITFSRDENKIKWMDVAYIEQH